VDPFVLFRVVELRRNLEFDLQRLDTEFLGSRESPYNSLVSTKILSI
jgi:hypothetical protein